MEPIKIEDIRIGNWASRPSQPDGFQIDIASLFRLHHGAKDYFPLPITYARLEKFGFTKWKRSKVDTAWRKGELMVIDYDARTGNWYYENGEAQWDGPGWQYIHELQNFYRVWTGKELSP